MISERPFEELYYEFFRSKINISDFPESWWVFLQKLRSELHYSAELNEIEKNVLWQAGCSIKTGFELIRIKKIKDCSLRETVIETAALQLIIMGAFLQLRGWVNKLRIEGKGISLVKKVKRYIMERQGLKDFRNAIAHSGDNGDDTYFVFSSDQTVKFKTKQAGREVSISVFEVMFASLLLWIVFSEWANNKIVPN